MHIPGLPIWLIGLATGLAAGFWQKTKALFSRVLSLVVVQMHVDDTVGIPVRVWAVKTLRQSPSGIHHYFGGHYYVGKSRTSLLVPYESMVGGGRVFWKNWRPLWIDITAGTTGGVLICYIRGMFQADNLIKEALSMLQSETAKSKCRDWVDTRRGSGAIAGRRSGAKQNDVFAQNAPGSENSSSTLTASRQANVAYSLFQYHAVRLIGHDFADLIQKCSPTRQWSRLSLSREAEEIRQEVSYWLKSQDWYLDRGIPWRRGYLLHGPAGCGKTSVVSALGAELNLPVLIFDLASMDNRELHDEWERANGNTPCIILMEDLDAVFDGRTNVLGEMGGGLSFDALLNTISGVTAVQGILLFITTNNPHTLDPAIGVPAGTDNDPSLSSRPGRLDRAVYLGPPDEAGRAKIIRRILDDLNEDEIEVMVQRTKDYTAAQVQEACCQAAEKKHWEKYRTAGNGQAKRCMLADPDQALVAAR